MVKYLVILASVALFGAGAFACDNVAVRTVNVVRVVNPVRVVQLVEDEDVVLVQRDVFVPTVVIEREIVRREIVRNVQVKQVKVVKVVKTKKGG